MCNRLLRTGLILALAIALLTAGASVASAEETADAEFYQSTSDMSLMSEDNSSEAVDRAYGITAEMCKASYWIKRAFGDADAVLMDAKQIEELNATALNADETNMYDLPAITTEYNADNLAASLSKNTYRSDKGTYIDGVKVEDPKAYFENLSQAILDTGYTGQCTPKYAVAIARTDVKSWPISGMYGYTSDDWDDELESSALCVNEPFVIKQTCTVGEEVFYWGYSNNCTGWVKGNDLAICADYHEWLDAWQVDINAKDFITVTQNKIVLEPSVTNEYSSEVKLTIGTILKTLTKEEKAQAASILGERNTWNNYVVWLPTRNEDGMYEKKPALISQHYYVSEGFLPYTQREILQVAFSCLGDRYGWGGTYGAMDCTLYIRSVYRCFGFELPRNTTWQQKIPGTTINLAGMSDSNRQKLLETMPAGTALFFSGHGMLLTGTENETGYVISAVGTLYDTEDVVDGNPRKANNVVLNPLTVKRGNGNSWLTNLSTVVNLVPAIDMSSCQMTLTADKDGSNPKVTVTYQGSELYEGVNYTVDYSQDETEGAVTATVTGVNNFKGSNTTTYEYVQPEPTPEPEPTPDPSPVPDPTPVVDIASCKVVLTANKDGSNPKVTVTYKDSKLKQDSDYTAKITRNSAKGLVKATVTGINKFKGSKTVTFVCTPKTTYVKKIYRKSKGFKVVWSKRTKGTTGYQIRYSRKSSMSKAKKIRITSNSTCSKTVKKLKAKKKYYVQVRTYKKYNGKYYYSAWSKKKAVTTK